MRVNIRRVARHRRIIKEIAAFKNRLRTLPVAEIDVLSSRRVNVVPRVARLLFLIRPDCWRRRVSGEEIAFAPPRLVEDRQHLVNLISVPCQPVQCLPRVVGQRVTRV